jgi:hypothetical protein
MRARGHLTVIGNLPKTATMRRITRTKKKRRRRERTGRRERGKRR